VIYFLRAVFITLVLSSFNSAYGQFIFTKQINTNYWFKGVIEENANGDLLFASTTLTNTATYVDGESSIFEINKYGTQLDSIKLDSNLIFNGPVLKISANYYLCAEQIINHAPSTFMAVPVVYKYDLSFNLLKKSTLDALPLDEAIVNDNLVLKNGRLYMAFWFSNSDKAKVYKLDLNFNKLDSMMFNCSFLGNLANYGNDKLLLSGGGFPAGSTTGKNQVMELDTNFNLISKFNLDSITSVNPGCFQKIGMSFGHCNLYELASNKYMVSGFSQVVYNSSCNYYFETTNSIIKNNSQVLKTNISGKPGVHNFFNMPVTSSTKMYNFVFSIADAGYSGTNPYPPQSTPSEIFINKTDTAGNIVWTKLIGTPNYYYSPMGICGTLDSGIVITGMRYNIASPAVIGACEGFVLKLDKNGNLSPTDIQENNKVIQNGILFYPNPSSGVLNLTIIDNKFAGLEMEIVNSLGQVILKQTFSNSIDISRFTQGLYTIKVLSSDQSVYYSKFIKE
jgi:hypothetical protein